MALPLIKGWQRLLSFFTIVFLMNILPSQCAPAFKLKHYNFYKNKQMSPLRAERRLSGGSSPIHFISPFVPVAPPVNPFQHFFVPPMSFGGPPKSAIYKLPLQLVANGKPHNVIRGLPKKNQLLEYLPHSASNMIRLPLKFLSNAKPVGVYFRDSSLNLL